MPSHKTGFKSMQRVLQLALTSLRALNAKALKWHTPTFNIFIYSVVHSVMLLSFNLNQLTTQADMSISIYQYTE